MPEGDTVFVTAQRLNATLAGQVITRFDLRVPQLALADATGEAVTEVVSVGKHLLIRLTGDWTLHSHLRIDGSWRVYPASQTPHGGPPHTIRAIVGCETSTAYGYRVHDLAMVRPQKESDLIGHLGPDLLAVDFDLTEGLRRFDARGADTIGEALLDQRLVAGIGNVYRSELLFLHGLDPWQRVDSVSGLEPVLTDASRLLKANCRTFHRTTTGSTRSGEQYYVYGRAGRGCRRCGARIRQAELGRQTMERVLYYCPACQHVD